MPAYIGETRQSSTIDSGLDPEGKYFLKFRFTGHGLPPHQNRLNQMHWGQRLEEKKKWRERVALITIGHRPKEPVKIAVLTLTRGSTTSPDSDGLVGSFKMIIDALVYLKVLEDDNFKHIKMPDYRWEKTKNNSFNFIEVQVVERAQDGPA